MSNNGHEMETRVATLEEKARVQEHLNSTLFAKLDAMLVILSELKINSALAKAAQCPAPGKCLEHTAVLNKMQHEIDTMKEFIQEQKGGWKYLLAMGSAAATLGAVVSWALTYLKGHTP